jgi:hypothetical protein
VIIEHTDVIFSDVNTVYNLVRDDLQALTPFLPNIKSIQQDERRELEPGRHEIINTWHANIELPSFMKRFISEDFFSWLDSALWDDEGKLVHYKLTSKIANDLFDANGVNSFINHDNGMAIKMRAELVIHPQKLPGIPLIMAHKVAPMIESLVVKMIKPNLTSLSTGIKNYLAKSLH